MQEILKALLLTGYLAVFFRAVYRDIKERAILLSDLILIYVFAILYFAVSHEVFLQAFILPVAFFIPYAFRQMGSGDVLVSVTFVFFIKNALLYGLFLAIFSVGSFLFKRTGEIPFLPIMFFAFLFTLLGQAFL